MSAVVVGALVLLVLVALYYFYTSRQQPSGGCCCPLSGGQGASAPSAADCAPPAVFSPRPCNKQQPCPAWTKHEKTDITSGHTILPVLPKDGCKAGCVANPQCAGVVELGEGCYLKDNVQPENQVHGASDMTLWTLQRAGP